MTDASRRKALREQYEQTRPEAGVYRIVNTQNGKALLGSTPNLASVRNKLAFARSTNVSSEVLEVLETTPEMSPAQVFADLATLEELWREKLDPTLLY